MSYIPKLFLETSIFNFYNYGKGGKKQQDTRMLFDQIKAGQYLAYTSEAVLQELKRAPKEMYAEMLKLVKKYTVETFPEGDQIDRLAGIYVSEGIIPEKYGTDAEHIATATVHGLDCVVRFNMGHIVKPKTMIGTGFVNLYEGYRWIGLATPTELINFADGGNP
jgi:predicted nucleic acid-binding protein